MAPLVRPTWAPRGRPPDFPQKAGHREKVSVIAGLWLSPGQTRLRLAYDTLPNGYFANCEVVDFLDAAVRALGGRVTVVWDGGTMHKGDPIRDLVRRSAGRLDIEPLPAHAPTLNPVEFVWRWLKDGRLCNFAPRDAADLDAAIRRELDPIRNDHALLRAFFDQSELPTPLTLLS